MRPGKLVLVGACRRCGGEKAGRCSACRRADYHRGIGHLAGRCASCGQAGRLRRGGWCASCLALAGLKECSRCGELRLLHLDFCQKQGICRYCRRPLGHLSPSERSAAAYQRRLVA